MGTTLDNAMSRLAAELPLREEQIEELMRLLRELHKGGWDGTLTADEVARRLVAKNGAMRHEIKKLEDLLVQIHRTVGTAEIRGAIEQTIPRRLAREEGVNA